MKRLAILPIGIAIGLLAPAAANASPGAQLWAQAGCGDCHTLAASGSGGQAGPTSTTSARPLPRIAQQITYGGSAMPSFSGTFSAAEIQSLASWVASVAGGGSSTGGSGSATTGGSIGSGQPRVGRGCPPGRAGFSPPCRLPRCGNCRSELVRLGYFPPCGHWLLRAGRTAAAVKMFQRAVGLKPDGIWGPLSAAALKRRLA